MKKMNKLFVLLFILIFFISLGNESFWGLFYLILIIFIIYRIYRKVKSKETVSNNITKNINYSTPSSIDEPYYEARNYLTPSEVVFYYKLLNVNDNFIIIPQVPLSSIVRKVNGKYQNELNRIIDFGIFDKNFRLLLLVELNDSSHNQINRKDRDLKVKKILDDCFIKLLTFYQKYPNEQEYITKRINDALNISKES